MMEIWVLVLCTLVVAVGLVIATDDGSGVFLVLLGLCAALVAGGGL